MPGRASLKRFIVMLITCLTPVTRMDAALDLAAMERLAESPFVGMEESAPAVGGVAVGEFLLEHEAQILAPIGFVGADDDAQLERHVVRRPQLQVLADQPHRFEMVGDAGAVVRAQSERASPT